MKYFGNISDNQDLVNKKYVDDNSGGTTPNDGSLILATDSNEGSSLFTANQSGTSKLIFVSGTGISLSQENSSITITNTGSGSTPNSGKLNLAINDNTAEEIFNANQSSDTTITLKSGDGISISKTNSDITITNTGSGSTPNNGILQVAVPANNGNSNYNYDLFTANQSGNSSLSIQAGTGISITGTTGHSGSSTITITNTGSGGNGGYYKYSISTASENSLSIPVSYKNVVVKFYYSNISTPGGGLGKSYTLGLASEMTEGNEMFIYLRNVGDTAGVNIQIPSQLSFIVDNKAVNYPVVYNGYYNTQTITNDNPTNLIYNSTNPTTYSAVTYHIFFDGEVYYVNRLHYYTSSPVV